ncbi:MAG: APC family permease [Oligoflexia bacterium]|nr:APC family permease [Oligoflexia bacterium]
MFTQVKRLILGQPLLSHHAEDEKIPKWKALSTLSSDAVSSVAYASDAILSVLRDFTRSGVFIGAAAAAYVWSIPVALMICTLLVILVASYRQTISAYPNGGGAYIVAKENLGVNAGLVAGAALLIDYVLTVSVSVSSGLENIGSAFPFIMAHKQSLGAVIILIIALLNLRGVRDSATVFAFPTYAFIFSIFTLIGLGLWRAVTGQVQTAPLPVPSSFAAVPLILVLRAFAEGCTALTGVEAISNGVQIFRPPADRNAKITMVWMGVILGALFLGITALAHLYAQVPVGDETLISLLGRTVFGGGTILYYFTQISTALILFLAANTSYADFPRLASLLANDRFLPRQLASMGDRLVFSNGILGLSAASMGLIVIFGGETMRLLPLYAIGVFISFTLSQAGMVVHHLREKEPNWLRSLLLNALGALTTFVVLLDIGSTKLLQGAWMVLLCLPIMVLFFRKIHKHYMAVGRELTLVGKKPPAHFKKIKHTVVIPISGIHQGVLEALQYALSISEDVRAVYVEIDPAKTTAMKEEWVRWVPGVPFVVLKSPYRSVIEPLIKYIDDVEECSHDDVVTVVVPEFVTARWWHNVLHNQTALFIRAALALRRRRVVTSVRYHITGR